MIRLNKLQTLEDISKKHQFLIIDSSALNQYYKSKNTNNIKGKTLQKYLVNLVGLYPIFITSRIERECVRGACQYKKRLQQKGVVNPNRDKRYVHYRHIKKKQLQLSNIFQINNKILPSLEDQQEYQKILRKYYPFAEELSQADLDFLITGALLVTNGAKVALLSNDLGIFRAMQSEIKTNENLPFEKTLMKKLGFFIRAGLNSFRKMYIR